MQKSSSNMPLYKIWLKRYRMIGILLWVGFLIAALIYNSELARRLPDMQNPHPYDLAYFISDASISVQLGFSMMLAAVATSLACFRFLHDGQECDMVHSLPPQRSSIFLSVTAAALTLLLLPLLFSTLLFGLVALANGVFSLLPLLVYFLMMLGCAVLAFGLGTFAAMLTGKSIIQGVIVLLFCTLPLAVEVLVRLYVQRFFFGSNPSGDLITQQINPAFLLPQWLSITAASLRVGQLPGLVGYALFFLVGCLAIAFAMFIYRRRPLEMAGKGIAVKALHPLIRVLCGFLCAASLYGITIIAVPAVMHHSVLEILLNILGAFIGCWAFEALLCHTVKVRVVSKAAVCVAGVMAVAVLGLQLDITGYNRAQLSADNVSYIAALDVSEDVCAAMQEDAAPYSRFQEYDIVDDTRYLERMEQGVFEKIPSAIAEQVLAQDARVYSGEEAADAIQLQQMLSGLSSKLRPAFGIARIAEDEVWQRVFIIAKQPNGHTFERTYTFCIRPGEYPELTALIEKVEQQNKAADIPNAERILGKAKLLTLNVPFEGWRWTTDTLYPGEWDALKAAYLADMRAVLDIPLPVDIKGDPVFPFGYMYAMVSSTGDSDFSFPIHITYQSTIAWLIQNGHATEAQVEDYMKTRGVDREAGPWGPEGLKPNGD